MSNRIRSAPLTSDRAFAAGEAAISNNTSETAQAVAPSVLAHGARVLPNVTIDTYNEELRDADGFVGDRASGLFIRRCNCERSGPQANRSDGAYPGDDDSAVVHLDLPKDF